MFDIPTFETQGPTVVPPWSHRGAAGVPHAVPGPAAFAAGARLPGGLAPGLRQVRAAGDGGRR